MLLNFLSLQIKLTSLTCLPQAVASERRITCPVICSHAVHIMRRLSFVIGFQAELPIIDFRDCSQLKNFVSRSNKVYYRG